MAFCVKCGAYIAEGSNACPACGKKVGQPEQKKTKTSSSGSSGAAAQAAQESQKTQQKSQTRKDTQSTEKPRQENRGSAKTDTSGTYTYNNTYNNGNTQAGNSSANTNTGSAQSGEYHYSYNHNYNNNTEADTNEVWEDAKKAWEDTKKTWGGVKQKWTRKVKNQYNNNYSYDYSANTRGVNGVYSVSDQESRPMIAILSYFGLLFLVPYILRNDSEFARFHANQGLLLFLCGAASSVAAGMPFLGWLCGAVGWVFTVVCFFKGINNVIKGRFRELPIIGKIRLLR